MKILKKLIGMALAAGVFISSGAFEWTNARSSFDFFSKGLPDNPPERLVFEDNFKLLLSTEVLEVMTPSKSNALIAFVILYCFFQLFHFFTVKST